MLDISDLYAMARLMVSTAKDCCDNMISQSSQTPIHPELQLDAAPRRLNGVQSEATRHSIRTSFESSRRLWHTPTIKIIHVELMRVGVFHVYCVGGRHACSLFGFSASGTIGVHRRSSDYGHRPVLAETHVAGTCANQVPARWLRLMEH